MYKSITIKGKSAGQWIDETCERRQKEFFNECKEISLMPYEEAVKRVNN